MALVRQARDKSDKLFADAGRFLAAGDEESAKQTLARKAIVDQQVVALDTQAAEIGQRQVTLEANQRELQTRIEGFKAEKEMIKARHAAAKANAQIGETVTGIAKDGREAQKAVGRITEATEQLEARGDALSELIQSGALEDVFNPGQSPLDRQALEMARNESVEADLAKLQKQLPVKTES
jgi:phage shock protein A